MGAVDSIVEDTCHDEPAAGEAKGLYGGSMELGLGKISGSAFKEGISVGRVDGGVVDVGLGNGNDGLADFEMNGVSSLLKMKESSRRGNGEVAIDARTGSDEGIGENSESLRDCNEELPADLNPDGLFEDPSKHKYSIGDFVWGKIKNRPWWPGRIYNPLDASEYAAKHRTDNNMTLVSYFGEGTFAWCNSSRLKPFEENFEAFSNKSSSRNFTNAVKAVLDEIGGVVNLRMTCSCAPNSLEASVVGRRLNANSGIKDGVAVPDRGIEKLAVGRLGPCELISNLRKMASAPSSSSMLYAATIKSWLMAFYRMKGISELPTFYEPIPVPGLEDQGDVVIDSLALGVPFQGPAIEECLSPSPLPVSKESMMKKCSMVSRDEASSRRKEKSILEILGLNGEGIGHNKPFDEKGKAEVNASGISTAGGKRRGRKRKASAVAENGESEIKEVSGVPVTSEAKVGVSNTSQGLFFRERKKSKYLSSLFTNATEGHVKKDKDANHLMCTPPIFEEKFDDPATTVSETSDVVGDKTDEQNKVRDVPLVDFPQAKEAGTVSDDEEMFLPLCRTSVFRDGPNYKNSNKNKPGWRRKFPKMEPHSTLEGAPIIESSDHEEFSLKSDAIPLKKRGAEDDVTPKSKASVKDDVRWLLITFKQSSPLPTKEDLIDFYRKYGKLDENETIVHYNSKYALVVFKKISDAEEALKCSRASSPFGASGAEFELLSANSTPYCTREQQQPSIPRKRGRPKKVAAAEPTGDTSKVQSLKQKLEKISYMLEETGGKLSKKVKTHLKDEIKGLLELVS